jgi:histidinol-phosphate phosphatase family protein
MNLHHLVIDPAWTLFLDRDGVINRRLVDDYVKAWNQFEFIPGVLDAIKTFHQIFGRIIVVSNQQGIGKGWMTEKDVESIHLKMIEEISLAGGKIDAVFYSPHLEAGRSIMRKPNIGMALKARRQFPDIRFNKSVMAGDSLSDMIFGKRVGMKTVLISENSSIAKMHPRLIDYQFSSLISLADS